MSRRVREPLPKLPLAPRGRSARRSLSSGPTESRNWVSCAEGLCKPIAGPQVGFQGLLLTSRRDGDERKGAEELLAAVTRIRMRQTSRERTKQAAIRAPRTPKEAPAGPPPSEGVVRTLEDCRATLKQFLSSRPVGAAGLDEVAFLCGCAFEGMDADLCVEAVNSFGQAIARASQAALRSSSSAGACAMFASVLRHPEESCRRAATTEAQKQLDAQQLLRAIGQGVGGKEPCRRLTASASLLQAVRLLVSRPEALDRLRASDGFRLAVEAWKQGTHIPEVAQECCALMLQLASQHARAAAAAGAAECALSSWQRCGTATDLSLRAALVHGFAEVSCLCLPFFPEKPQVLCRLACESLRALLSSGPEPVIFALLKVLRKLTDDPKTAPELFNLGLPDLALGVLGQDRLSNDGAMRRMAAEVVVRTVSYTLNCQSKHPAICASPSTTPHSFRLKAPELPSAEEVWNAELQTVQLPQPTYGALTCAAALRRRLEIWKVRSAAPRLGSLVLSVEEAPALLFDADFESGSLGPVTRMTAREYEVQLLSDAGGGYVQWFCFRVRNMRVGMPYTFHLTNLVKPGSLFDDGCQPVLFSRRRMEDCGVGWSREGTDVAYYPCGFGAGARKHYCVSFDVVFPFEEDECFLAYSVPYSYTDLLADLARWPVETEALALTAAGKEVLALRLGNQSAQHRACIVARAHPGETHASWVMRGVMEFLMGDPEAQSCLDQLAWLLVPMLNPDGVMAGRTRTNLDAVDLNRHHHDDSAPETKGLKNALQAEAREGELLAFIDIHSHSRRRGIFAIANASDGDRLVSLMASRTHLLDAAGTSRSEIRAQDAGVGRVAAASQGYKYSLTIESSLCARHVEVGGEHLLLQDLASVGRSICLAVADLLSSTDETTNQTPPETAKVPNSMFAEGVVDAEDHDEADEEAVLEERRPDSS